MNLKKWWVYQKERFPVFAHGVLILSFSFCAVSYSSHLGGRGWPDYRSVIIAFVSSFLFFLQLRIADEFKDKEEDAKFRPYRPVPRGLVSLKDLGVLFFLCALIQMSLAIYWKYQIIIWLLVAWAYLGGMSFEFGCRNWLKQRPILYLLSHMLIMPIVDFYATTIDWVAFSEHPGIQLLPFLIASFFNGIVIEIGRKIRLADAEEKGVETYSFLWGYKRASFIWLAVMAITLFFGIVTLHKISQTWWVYIPMILCFLYTATFVYFHVYKKHVGIAKKFELISAIWTLVLYSSIGILGNY